MDSVRLVFQINRKIVNTICFRFGLIRFRKDFSVWHSEEQISDFFQIERNVIIVTVFLLIINQTEFHLNRNWKENIFHSIWKNNEIYFCELSAGGGDGTPQQRGFHPPLEDEEFPLLRILFGRVYYHFKRSLISNYSKRFCHCLIA